MRDLTIDEVPVGAHQAAGLHVRVMNGQLVTLADQPLGERHQRRFPKIIGAGLEGQPEERHLAAPATGDHVKRPVDMRIVAAQHLAQQRQLQFGLAREGQQSTQIFRQAGAAEGISRTQIGRRNVQLGIETEDLHRLAPVHAE